ncbi:hypothetical protein D3C75_1381630 [compost metagenome]
MNGSRHSGEQHLGYTEGVEQNLRRHCRIYFAYPRLTEHSPLTEDLSLIIMHTCFNSGLFVRHTA